MSEYATFINSKLVFASESGFSVAPSDIHPMLFDWQREVVIWALRLGKAALFEECGLGKTLQQLEWARHVANFTGGKVLICSPLAVAHQTIAEGAKIDIPVRYVRSGSAFAACEEAICITNYDMLKEFDGQDYAGVVLDECFPPDTLVNVFSIDGYHRRKYIKDIHIGDEIVNAMGVDIVSDVHRRKVEYAVKITVAGKAIISSPNHPYFTQRGWVAAQDLEPQDSLMETTEAMRVVRRTIPQVNETIPSRREILQQILFSEMAYETTGDCGAGSYERNSRAHREESISMAALGRSESNIRDGAHPQTKPDGESGDAPQGLPHLESDAPQTFRAWGQRNWIDESTTDITGCTRRELGSRISFITGQANSRLSHLLQAGLSERRAESVYRSGWDLTPQQEEARRKEGREIGFARVDSLEILEQGHPELEQYRASDGFVYFYDIGATQHPSFSVEGFLVHNSSILKAYTGATKRMILEMFENVPYKLACTATPAPNDHLELGNHAQFLNVMDSNEMISRWFINDTMQAGHYRLKAHAAHDFWRWMTTWAVSISKPSDLGYADDGFALPELHITEQRVSVDHTRAWADGKLFITDALSATTMWEEKRETLHERCARAREIVESINPSEAIALWCDTNAEADALKRLFPGALEVRGNDTLKQKEERLSTFSDGSARLIITKPDIAGFGLNWQHCHNTIFVGVSYSFEKLYQALRRFYRFRQTHDVEAHLIYAETEGNILKSLRMKQEAHHAMQGEMNRAMKEHGLGIHKKLQLSDYKPSVTMELPTWLR